MGASAEPPPGPDRPNGANAPGDSAYERAFEVFSEARELSVPQRAEFVARACGGDTSLRTEVESLLAHDIPEGDDVRDAASRAVASAAARVLASRGGEKGAAGGGGPIPERIGRYRIVRRIAEGGMGVVYEARQEQPTRTVALKVVRSDMATPGARRRLEHEAEALAQFSHPGLAQVYESGTHDGGSGPQPFFAMEFVRGVRLDEWVKEKAPPLRERIALVAEIAEAVHHAHQRGVVHRDLKPANVLVQDGGRPKVLDFGIARLAGGLDAEATLATQAGQVLGTLPYMSPEQLSGRAGEVDTRTDVYALGVLLYEVLSGRLPIDVTSDALASAARRVCEEEPAPLGRLDPRCRGDVQTIVAKALAKERAERYASAQAFADDLRRYLADAPIEARPPSAVYVLTKFARRHKALAAALALLVATLAASAAGGAWLASLEGDARRLADQRAKEAADERDEARHIAYRGALAAASAFLSEPDVARAEGALLEAPESARGWEWRYLRARLDDSLLVVVPREGREYRDVRLLPEGLVLVDYPRGGIHGRLVWRDLGDSVGPERDAFDLPGFFPSLADSGDFVYVESGDRMTPFETRTGKESASVRTPLDGDGNFSRIATDRRHSFTGTRLDGGFRVRVMSWPDPQREPPAEWILPWGEGIRLSSSSDASLLVASVDSSTAWVLRRGPNGDALPAVNHSHHGARISWIAVAPDGKRVATCASDSSYVTWEAATGTVRLRGQGRPDEVRGIAFGPDPERLLTWGADGSVKIREASSGRPLASFVGHRGPVGSAFFSEDGRRVVSRGEDGTVRMWSTGASDEEDFTLLGHRSYVYEAKFSPDGTRLATMAWDGTGRIWDVRSRAEIRRFEAPEITPGYTMPWSPDGTRVVVVQGKPGVRSTTRVIDLATGKETELSPSSGPDRVARWSPRGDFLVVKVPEGLRLLDGRTYVEQGLIPQLDSSSIAISSDGALLAIGEGEGPITIWDVARRTRLRVLEGHTQIVRDLAFHPTEPLLASASCDGTIRTWDAASGKALATLRWHRGRTHAVAFSPDGTRLFSGGDDGRLAVWDVGRHELLLSIPAHGMYVHSIDVSRDGSTVVTGSGDSKVRLWTTAPRADVHRAREASAGR